MSATLLDAFVDELERLVDLLAAAVGNPHALGRLPAEPGATTSATVPTAERDALIAAFRVSLNPNDTDFKDIRGDVEP